MNVTVHYNNGQAPSKHKGVVIFEDVSRDLLLIGSGFLDEIPFSTVDYFRGEKSSMTKEQTKEGYEAIGKALSF